VKGEILHCAFSDQSEKLTDGINLTHADDKNVDEIILSKIVVQNIAYENNVNAPAENK
jgi:hypothetical protein